MKKLITISVLFGLLSGLALVACGSDPSPTSRQNAIHWVHYYKDTRTDLCFAGYNLGSNDALLTQVPCSPEVEKLTEPWDRFYK
jgi:hypothetical protein